MHIFAFVDLESDWYPKNALALFQRYSSLQFTKDPTRADIIWIFSYYTALRSVLTLPPLVHTYLPLRTRRRAAYRHKPIVTTIHHLTPEKRKHWQDDIRLLDQITDVWQSFSVINLPQFKTLLKKPIHILPYWIDEQQFFPLTNNHRIRLRQKYSLPNDQTIVGSFQRDTETDLVTPKLEKGPDILFDVVARQPNIFVLLAGPRRQYLERKLAARNIPYRSLGKVSFQVMNELYATIDYYLVTSRHEGGPQAILEAMATRTKIFSTPVGIADTLNQAVVLEDPARIAEALQNPYPDVLEEHYQKTREFHCRPVVARFEKFFQGLSV